MAHPDELRRRWRAGEATYGGWVVGRDPVLVERMARCGFHEVTIHLQHAPVGEGDIPALTMAIAAGGAVPLVRVPALDRVVIGRVLDLGAAGVIAPLVDDREAAAALVAACRYPPRGTRSTGPIRARYLFGSDEPADLEEVIRIVTIESARGLDRVEAIAGTPGVTSSTSGRPTSRSAWVWRRHHAATSATRRPWMPPSTASSGHATRPA